MSLDAQQISYQEAVIYADQLVQKEILNAKGKETLLREIRGKRIETEHESTVNPITYTEDALSKETILQFCASAFLAEQIQRLMKKRSIEAKIKQEDKLLREEWNINLNYMMGAKYGGSISTKRSTIGYTRTRTLKEVKELGLISDVVFDECSNALQTGEIKDEPELLRYMLNRTIYYNYYDFNKKEQEEYISHLVSQGILTEEAKKALLTSYEPYELKSKAEILSFSNRYLLADVTDIESEPNLIYATIFPRIQQLIPDFKFRGLKVVVMESDEGDLIREDIKLSFSIDENTYTHTFFHDYKRKVPDPTIPVYSTKVAEEFHKGVNKWLTDIESPYRLFTINMPDSAHMVWGANKVGLLLLKEGEVEQISRDPNFMSTETFDNRLSRKSMGKFIEDMKAIGVFSHLTHEQLKRAEEELFHNDFGSMGEAMLAFPHTVVLFDWETGNLQNPYEELTQAFAQASRGAFTPTEIVDNFEKGFKKARKIKYSFRFNGKLYEAMLPFVGDWLAPEFMELIKTALKENDVDGRIYYCLDNGQEGGYIFLTHKQYAFIKDKYPDLVREE